MMRNIGDKNGRHTDRGTNRRTNRRINRRTLARRVVAASAAFVLVSTGYVLSRPAHAVSSDRELICGKEEHVHAGTCFDEEGKTVCGLEEHIHNEACYGPVTGTDENGIVKEDAAGDAEEEGAAETEETDGKDGNDSEKEDEEAGRTFRAEGADYLVTAVVPADAEIPESAEFLADEIPADSEDYRRYLEEAKAKMTAAGDSRNEEASSPEDGESDAASGTPEETVREDAQEPDESGEEEEQVQVLLARFFDIRFVENGTEIEPKQPVSIQISYTGALQIGEDGEGTAAIVHFADHGTEMLKVVTGKAQEDSRTIALTGEQQSMLLTDAGKAAQDAAAVGSGSADEAECNRERLTGIAGSDVVDTFAFAQSSFSTTGTIVVQSSLAQQKADSRTQMQNRLEKIAEDNVNTKNQSATLVPADTISEDAEYIIFVREPDEKNAKLIRALDNDTERGQSALIGAALSSDGISVYASGNDGADFDKAAVWKLKKNKQGKPQLYNEKKKIYISMRNGFPFSKSDAHTLTITRNGCIIASDDHTYLNINGNGNLWMNDGSGTEFCFAEIGSPAEEKAITISCFGERITRQEDLKAGESYVLVCAADGEKYSISVGDVPKQVSEEAGVDPAKAKTKIFTSHQLLLGRDERLIKFIDTDIWRYNGDGQFTNQSFKTRAISNDLKVYLNRTAFPGQALTCKGSRDSAGFLMKFSCKENGKTYALKAYDNVKGAEGYNAYTAAKNYRFSGETGSGFEVYHVVKYGYDVWFDATNGNNNFYTGGKGNGKSKTMDMVRRVTPKNGEKKAAVVLPREDEVKADTGYRPGYRLAGWYDTNLHKSYKPGETAYVEGSTVFYASWMAADYNIGQAVDLSPYSVYQPSITTSVFDYNEICNMPYSYRLPSSYLTGAAHRETWAFLPDTKPFTFLYAQQTGMLVRAASRDGSNKSKYTSRNAGLYTGLVTPGIFDGGIENTLFSRDTSHAQDGYCYVGDDHHLYSYDPSTGYYYYDSDLNAADYNQSAGRFYVHNYVNGTDKSSGKDKGDFLPFNSGAKTFGETRGEVNYWFGMRTQFGFTLPNPVSDHGKGNKSICGDPLVYKFSGDDDVWVFVDGKLALDLGGIHDRVYGEINFTDNTVTIAQGGAAKIDATRDGDGHLKNIIGVSGTNGVTTQRLTDLVGDLDAGLHSLTFYYMERGASESDAAIYFNIAPSYRVDMTKTGMGGQKLSGAEFKIYTDKTMKTEAQNLVPVPGGGTEIRYGADGGRTYVSKDSEFRLDGFVADCNYYIQEVKAPTGYQKLQAPAKLKIFYQEGGDFEGFRARIYFNKYENGVLKSYTNNTFNISSEINGYGGCGGYHIYIPNTISGQRLPDTGFTDRFRKYHLLAALGAAVLVAALAYLAGRCRVQNH